MGRNGKASVRAVVAAVTIIALAGSCGVRRATAVSIHSSVSTAAADASRAVPAPYRIAETITRILYPAEHPTGADVVAVQAMLRALGRYDGPIHGRYDGDTVASVKRFQQQLLFTPDGETGPNTYDRLLAAVKRRAANCQTPRGAEECAGLRDLQFGPGPASVPDSQSADQEIHILINGKELHTQARPFFLNDRTMVPVRVIAEELSARVEWNQSRHTVTLTSPERNDFSQSNRLILTIGSPVADFTIKDSYGFTRSARLGIGVAPVIRNDRTFVPFRVITEALDFHTEWDGRTRTVRIDTERPAVPSDLQVQFFSTEEPFSFPIYPATFRALDPRFVRRVNEVVAPLHDRLGLPYVIDLRVPRVRIRDARGKDFMEVYTSHLVKWYFNDEVMASVAMELDKKKLQLKLEHKLADGALNLALFLLELPDAPFKTILEIASARQEYDAELSVMVYDRCLDRADRYLANYLRDHSGSDASFSVGIVEAEDDMACAIPFTDLPVIH